MSPCIKKFVQVSNLEVIFLPSKHQYSSCLDTYFYSSICSKTFICCLLKMSTLMSNLFLVMRLPPVTVRSRMMPPGRAVGMTASIGTVTVSLKRSLKLDADAHGLHRVSERVLCTKMLPSLGEVLKII